jgi:hypothetical protein
MAKKKKAPRRKTEGYDPRGGALLPASPIKKAAKDYVKQAAERLGQVDGRSRENLVRQLVKIIENPEDQDTLRKTVMSLWQLCGYTVGDDMSEKTEEELMALVNEFVVPTVSMVN